MPTTSSRRLIPPVSRRPWYHQAVMRPATFIVLLLLGCAETAIPGEPLPDARRSQAPETATPDTLAPDADPAEVAEPSQGPWASGATLASSPQKPGDPDEGYYALGHYGYVSCGIPYNLFLLLGDRFGPAAGAETLPGREGLNKDLPYSWNVHQAPSGVNVVVQNCFGCHAGRFNGELVLGLGSADVDFTSNTGALADMDLDALPIPPAEKAELEKFLSRVKVFGPQTVMRTVGTNPAEAIAVTAIAHRDPETLAWSDEPLVEIPNMVIPSDPPPWWRAHKKNALFYNGMARGDHRGTMMLVSAVCTDTVEEAQEIDSYFHHINAYIQALRPPKYPFDIDEALADEGEMLYEESCAGCHGTHGEGSEDWTYPNLLIPLDVIGTDPVVAEGGTKHAPQLVEWYNASFYGQITQMVPNDPFPGYMPPPAGRRVGHRALPAQRLGPEHRAGTRQQRTADLLEARQLRQHPIRSRHPRVALRRAQLWAGRRRRGGAQVHLRHDLHRPQQCRAHLRRSPDGLGAPGGSGVPKAPLA